MSRGAVGQRPLRRFALPGVTHAWLTGGSPVIALNRALLPAPLGPATILKVPVLTATVPLFGRLYPSISTLLAQDAMGEGRLAGTV